MSRIGKLPVLIPTGVEVKIDGRKVNAKGARGELSMQLPRKITAELKDNQLVVKTESSEAKALWGLSRSLVYNLIEGVSEGYQKQLEIHGVGYRAQVSGDKLTLTLGFSHPVEYRLPGGIEAKTEGNTLTISGVDKQLVGQVAAEIRDFRRPEPYKGKGIRYVDEHVRRKAGKTASKTEGA